jgi:ubiquinone/menaquinone biosynthesis C-methylase UbiE
MFEQLSGTRGEIYEKHLVPAIFGPWARDLVNSARIRPGERVLDVACGTGVVTRAVAERVGTGGRVVGLDSNSDMLGAARTASSGSNIEWLVENAMSMSLLDASFDAVVCQQGFQFMPDKPLALREMQRVLVPGGRLALSVWRSVDQSPAFRVVRDYLARRLGPEKAVLRPFGLPDGQAIGAMVASAGFRDVKVRAEVKISRFQSPQHMVRSIVGGAPNMLGALVEQGGPDEIEALAKEIAGATQSYFDDEGWATPMASNIITAMA